MIHPMIAGRTPAHGAAHAAAHGPAQAARAGSGLAVLLAFLLSMPGSPVAPLSAQATTGGEAADAAPGALFIVGGGRQPPELLHRFIELAGGPDRANIAVIPLASADPAGSGTGKVEHFAEYGARSFVLLEDGAAARSPATVDRLREATAIWFNGGDQSRITTALEGTPLLEAIRAAHRRGVLVGGTSAGAAIMSPWMITGSQYSEDGDSVAYLGDEFPRIAREYMEVVPGLAFVSGVIVDQHFIRRERLNRLLSVVLERPDHIGVGIDESTALEVEPDGEWQVYGASAVLVVDARAAEVTDPESPVLAAAGLRMHLLPPGGRYDPATGTATLPTARR